MKDTTYTITFIESQLQEIITAIDLVGRLQMGQTEMLIEPYGVFGNRIKHKDVPQLEDAVNTLKDIIFPEISRSSYYGIYGDKTAGSAKVLYDIQQVLRHSIAWHNNPQGGHTVDFGDPLQASQNQPLPTVTNIKDPS